MPYEVTPSQWEQTYEEALQLVNAYDFLDIIRNRDRYAKYGLVWCYAEKSKEREIDGHLGVGIYGAYDGCVSAEDQILFRDLSKYLPKQWNTEEIVPQNPDALLCRDALIGRLYDIDELEKYQDCKKRIFGNKTQGYPHHVPLLAIGLLLEDRLGKAFTIYGDITRGQIKSAIQWANTILANPISLPDALDNSKLLERIHSFVPRANQISAFMNLTFSPCDEAMYTFLQSHFTEEELADYWKEEMSYYKPGMLGSADFFKSYFNMTGDLHLLTKICAANYAPEEFAKALASSRVFEQDKDTDNPIATLSADSDRDTPETIETVMGKTFALLGGGFPNNSAVKRYIPLEQGIEDITCAYRALGESSLDFKTLIKNAKDETAPKSKMVSEGLNVIDKFSNIKEEQADQVDIFATEDLVFYEPGDTMKPFITANLKGIREFIDNHKEDTTNEYLKAHANVEITDKKFTRMATEYSGRNCAV